MGKLKLEKVKGWCWATPFHWTMLGGTAWFVESNLLPICQADNLAVLAQLCLPETLTCASLLLDQRKWGGAEEIPVTQPWWVGERRDRARFFTEASQLSLFVLNLSIPTCLGQKGPSCFSAVCAHVPTGNTKAGGRKEPAKERQLFQRRARTITQVV